MKKKLSFLVVWRESNLTTQHSKSNLKLKIKCWALTFEKELFENFKIFLLKRSWALYLTTMKAKSIVRLLKRIILYLTSRFLSIIWTKFTLTTADSHLHEKKNFEKYLNIKGRSKDSANLKMIIFEMTLIGMKSNVKSQL